MSEPEFTVLLPVHRGPELLPFAVDSVLAQEVTAFELFIVCDGAPEATVGYAREAAKRHDRIRVFAYPKGQRYGEAHRHAALAHARGRFVCHIGDDDLWFPNHLAEMARLLRVVEFGNVPFILGLGEGTAKAILGDLGQEETRVMMREHLFNFFGITQAGYRLETYRRLADGWTPAPTDVYTDLHMWRKFLALPGIRCATRVAITNLEFTAAHRRDWPLEKRVGEIRYWAGVIRDGQARDALAQVVLGQIMRGEIERRERSKKERDEARAAS